VMFMVWGKYSGRRARARAVASQNHNGRRGGLKVVLSHPSQKARWMGHPIFGGWRRKADSSASLRNGNGEGLRNGNGEGLRNDHADALRSWSARSELGAAAAIDPDALTVITPGLPLNAGRAADLAR